MKRTLLVSIVLLFGLSIYGQDRLESMLIEVEANDTIVETSEHAIQDEPIKLEQAEKLSDPKPAETDSTIIRFGKRKIIVIEKDGSTSIEIPEKDDVSFKYESNTADSHVGKRKKRFKGHWAGFEWGFNGLMDSDFSTNMSNDLRYLELIQGRSWNFNLNILQYSLGLGTDKIGLVTGLGFEFNNYHFRNPVSIKVNNIGQVVPDSTWVNMSVSKSKLSTTHLTAPLLVEFQIPTGNDKHRVFLSTGVIGGVRIASSTRVEYDGDSKGKVKTKGDYNLSSFRYGITARVGYRSLKLFANYYPTLLFEENKGPEVYPFTIGLILLSFN